MTSAEIVAGFKAANQSEIDALVQKNADLDNLLVVIEAEAVARETAKYAEGKASVVLPSPDDPTVQFTQAQMDQLAATAKTEGHDAGVAELQPVVDDLTKQVETAKADMQLAEANLQQSIADFAAFKTSIQEKFQAQQEAETKLESEFANELK